VPLNTNALGLMPAIPLLLIHPLLQTKTNEIVMIRIKNAIDTADDIGNIIVSSYMGSPIYLKQVATVTKSYNIQEFKSAKISIKNDDNAFSALQDQVTLTVSKLQGTNAVLISEAVKEELEKYKEQLKEEGISYVITRNDGERANEAVNELVFHLLLSIIIIAVLLIFVLGWRESLIVTFSVPAILAITLFVAYLAGQTINRITLFAFLLSLGLLVDAAIIVIENIHRHYHSADAADMDTDELMTMPTDEIGTPNNIATFAIILTMVPMAFVRTDDGTVYETNSYECAHRTHRFSFCRIYLHPLSCDTITEKTYAHKGGSRCLKSLSTIF